MSLTHKFLYIVILRVGCSVLFDGQTTAQTVYDVPPDPAPNSISGTDILNLGEGGSIVYSLSAWDDSVINMTGGATNSMNIRNNATLLLSGGRIGRQIDTDPTANVQIYGAEFTIGGVPVLGLVNPGDRVFVTPSSSQTFSGTLTDGSVFAFRGDANDDLSGPIELILDSVPTFAPIVNAPADPLPNGIRSGQQVTLNSGAVLGYNYGASQGSVLNVDGGMVEGNLELIGAELNLNDGMVNGSTDVFLNSTINVSGGLLDDTTRLFDTSSINVMGGTTRTLRLVDNSSLNASSGSIFEASLLENTSATITGSVEIGSLAASNSSNVSVTGGTVKQLYSSGLSTLDFSVGVIESLMRVSGTAQATFTGGRLGHTLSIGNIASATVAGGILGDRIAFGGRSFELQGGDFRLDGVPIVGLENIGDTISFTVPEKGVFSGVLSDGSIFTIDRRDEDAIDNSIQLTRTATPTPSLTHFDVPSDPAPDELQSGQSLNLSAGGTLPSFFRANIGSTMQIGGGTVGTYFEAIGSDVTMTNGTIDSHADFYAGSHFVMSGGLVEGHSELQVFQTSTADISGGQLLSPIYAYDSATVTVTGGSLSGVQVMDMASLMVSGGSMNAVTATGNTSTHIGDGAAIVRVEGYGEASIDVIGGNIQRFDLLGEATGTVTGGVFSENIYVSGNSELFISGDASINNVGVSDSAVVHLVDARVDGNSGSFGNGEFRVTGGDIGEYTARGDSTLNMSGGTTGDNFTAQDNSNINFTGGEFLIDGVPIPGLNSPGDTVSVNIPAGSVFSGTLDDGSVIAFTRDDGDDLERPLNLTVGNLPPAINPASIPADGTLRGVRPGQVVNVSAGQSLPSNLVAAPGSTLTATGVTIGDNFEATGAEVEISDSIVGNEFDAFSNANVVFNNTEVGGGLTTFDTSEVTVNGGSLMRTANALHQSTLNLNSDNVNYVEAFDQATVNVTGGVLTEGSRIYDESQMNFIDGKLLGGISFFDSSFLHMTGGQITGGMAALSSSELQIDGGVIEGKVTGSTSAIINVSGGSLDDSIRLRNSATANISGGHIGAGYAAEAFSTTNLSGGAIGQRFGINDFGTLNIDGFDFRIDGVPVPGLENVGDERLSFNPPITGVFSGRLADGTPFAFSYPTGEDRLFDSGITINLKRSAEANGPALIQVPSDDVPWGIGSGQTLVLEEGGVLHSDFQSGRDSRLIVNGGTVGTYLEAVSSTVTINGGVVQQMDALLDARINLAGGEIRDTESLNDYAIKAWQDSEIHMTSGTIKGYVHLNDRATMTIEGGEIIDRILVNDDATLKLLGGGETLVYVDEISFAPDDGSLLLVDGGHLASGSVIETRLQVLSGMVGDSIHLRHAFMDVQGGTVGDRLQLTQTVLDISGGNIGNDISAVQVSEINMTGGAIGSGLGLFSSSTFNMWDGSIQEFQLFDRSTANIFGGELPAGFEVNEFATANVHGGNIDGAVLLYDEANLFVEGGDFSSSIALFNSSTADISGGSFGEGFFAIDGGTINIFGVGFLLNGLPIDGLTEMGDSLVLDVRDGSVLTGFLEDGSFFDIMLSSTLGGADFIAESATVMVTVTVPEPGTLVMALVGVAVIPLLTRKARRQI